MSRKRDKPYFSSRPPYPKRRRPHPSPPPEPAEDEPTTRSPPPPALLVTGLPSGCSVLDLKARFEIYGPISRIRINRDGVGYVTFRSRDSGVAAVSASLDSFGISIDSKRLQVLWATDPLAQWRVGVVGEDKKDDVSPTASSKLLRGELPLSRRGRGNHKLASAVVNPRSNVSNSSRDDNGNGGGVDGSSNASSLVLDAPFKEREIVAYDDIL